jgi:hypothetical protein
MPAITSQERLRQLAHMKMYLGDLGKLLGRTVFSHELCTLEQTARLQQESTQLRIQRVMSCEIPFMDMDTEHFRSFIQRLSDANPSPIYIWISHTIDCGALRVPSLMAVNFESDFPIIEGEIVVLATSDLKDRLLLDFFVSDDGKEMLKIETQGEHWQKVPY